MKITFLGTSAMTPTKERAQSMVLVQHEGVTLLLDCGENAQRQMRLADIAVPQLDALLITHWHGDHVLGLPGVFENLAKGAHEKKIVLYGPRGSATRVEKVMDAFGLRDKLVVDVHELTKQGVFYEGKHIVMEAIELVHSIPCIGFSIREPDRRKIQLAAVKKLGIPRGPLLGKLQRGLDIEFNGKKVRAEKVTDVIHGKKVVYITDTVYCPQAVQLAKNADVLICEATYSKDMHDVAKEHYHMTSVDAAKIAKEANVKKLFLTHFSQRYPDVKQFETEAKKIFKNVVCARDFLSVSV